jgi:excisionase family DNA binding protein
MKGLTIIETDAIDGLINRFLLLEKAIQGLEDTRRPWMTLKEVCQYMSKGSTWVDLNKRIIGFTKAGGELRFKRKDVDAYLESRYFKLSLNS